MKLSVTKAHACDVTASPLWRDVQTNLKVSGFKPLADGRQSGLHRGF